MQIKNVMSINRGLTKNKEVLYTVTTGDDVEFTAIIDEGHVLHVVYPGQEITRQHQRALNKLISKVKARDGVADYTIHTGYILEEGEKESIITPLAPSVTA